MKTHSRIVIVGGGIMGVGLLYHLAEEGCSDVMLCILVDAPNPISECVVPLRSNTCEHPPQVVSTQLEQTLLEEQVR